MSNYESYTTLNCDAVTIHPVVKRLIPNAQYADQYYQQLPLSYHEDNLIFEGCPMASLYGLQEQRTGSKGPGGGSDTDIKIDYSICCKLDLSSEDTRKFIEIIMAIYNKCAVNIDANKKTLGMAYFSLKHPEHSGFKEPFYYPTDCNTGERIVGRAPSIYWKLKQKNEQAVFYDNNNKFVPWHALEYMEMILIPTIHIRSVFINCNRASFQIDLVSAKILEMRPCNSISKQLDPQLSKWIVRYQQYSGDYLNYNPVQMYTIEKERRYRLPLMYNYGTKDNPLHDIFLLEGCEVNGSIQDNKMTCELEGPNQFTEMMCEFIKHCKYILNQTKGTFRILDVTNILKDPIANNRINLYLSQDPRRPTLFTDRTGKTMTLDPSNKKFRCIPLINVKHIEVKEGQAELKMELYSAIIITTLP